MKIQAKLAPVSYLAFHDVGPGYDLILYAGRFKFDCKDGVWIHWGRGISRGYKGVYGPTTFAGCKRAAKEQWGR